jgi:hypothetical protein
MLGLIESRVSMNSWRLAGEIIIGILLFKTLRSVNEIASRFVSDVAGALSIDFIGSIFPIFIIGNLVGMKN